MSKYINIIIIPILLAIVILPVALPGILRVTLPHLIHAKIGYPVAIEKIEVSFLKPALRLRGITLLNPKTGRETGHIEKLVLTGDWLNPLRGELISPQSLDIHGITFGSTLSEAGNFPDPASGGNSNLRKIRYAAFSFPEMLIENKQSLPIQSVQTKGSGAIDTVGKKIINASAHVPSSQPGSLKAMISSITPVNIDLEIKNLSLASLAAYGGNYSNLFSQVKADGFLDASVRIQNRPSDSTHADKSDVVTSGKISFRIQKLDSPLMTASKCSGELTFHGNGDRLEIRDAALKADTFAIKAKHTLDLHNLKLLGNGTLDISGRNVAGAHVTVHSKELETVSAELTSLFPLQFSLNGKSLALQPMLALASPYFKPLEGWEVDGIADVVLTAGSKGDIQGKATLDLRSASGPKGAYLAQNLKASFLASGKTDDFSPKGVWNVKALLHQGEALADNLYLNFESTPLSLELDANASSPSYTLDNGKLTVKHGPSVLFRSIAKEFFPLQINGEISSLNSFFTIFIKDTLAAVYPILNEISVQGETSWDFLVSKNTVTGRIRLNGESFAMGKDVIVEGFNLSLPVAYSSTHPSSVYTENHEGHISFKNLQTKYLSLQNQTISYNLANNRIAMEPTRFPFAGGMISISNAVISNVFSYNPVLLMNVNLTSVDINNLDVLPPPYKLEGILSSKDFSIKGSGSNVETSGSLYLDLFEGRAQIENISVENPLSILRRIRSSLSFYNIDLEELSRALSFGRVTGRIKGFLKNLSITGGQPEEFFLKVWSVPTKGVPQRVSFSAVNDIQTISSGTEQRKGVSSLLESFMNDLSYEEIGIQCVLKNDTFKVNGIVYKKNKEYFISRGGLFGIDVVNANPDNQISFKDMMERVKRVAEKRQYEIQG